MSPALHEFLSIDLGPILAATFACVSCALLGNFLVLRRISLMGDAISHAVLPGLVLAFMITGTRDPLAMFIGAAAAGILTVGLVEAMRRYTRIEPGAAMGVVFSVLFALGVLMLERGAGRQVDLDADCVLNGVLEAMIWFVPDQWSQVLTWNAIASLPRQVWTLAIVAAVVSILVAAFFKELRIVCFDPGLATSLGFPASAVNGAFMVLVACVTVASFEAVGSILVIAMLICPPAAARMLTDRLRSQVLTSVLIAACCAVGGYTLAAFGPGWIGASGSVSASGMIAVVSGVAMASAMLLGPRHGVIARSVRRARLAITIASEDLLAWVYRMEERARPANIQQAAETIGSSGLTLKLATALSTRLGLLKSENGNLRLTDTGRRSATELVRTHRLWESYLVERGGFAPDHVHDAAMRLEHAVDPDRGVRLEPPEPSTPLDPHQRPIPPRS
ncbi:MAG: metal ABC transporter permease [Phycisphaeraceae bacterium]|nr:metal ABC transporter permease [Phycisphaeraceae bacterium]